MLQANRNSRIKCSLLGLALLVAATCLPQARAEEPKPSVTIAADVWCPINCAPDAERLGIGVDLAKRVFEPLGYEVKYLVMPWSRALKETREGKINAAVGANATDDKTLLLPRHDIYTITDDFYVLADSKIAYKTTDSLRGLHVGIIRDYGYSPKVARFIQENKKIPGAIQEVGGDDALEQNIRKLLAGRIDVLIESKPVMDYAIKRLKLEGKMKRITSITQGSVYLAFSPALPESKQLIHLYDKGIAKLKAEGYLEKMYQPYGLSMPKEP